MRTGVLGMIISLRTRSAAAQSPKDVKGPTPLVATPAEAPVKLIADPAIPEHLAMGQVWSSTFSCMWPMCGEALRQLCQLVECAGSGRGKRRLLARHMTR